MELESLVKEALNKGIKITFQICKSKKKEITTSEDVKEALERYRQKDPLPNKLNITSL